MITVRIHGGLGNQMFQYALALSLKQKFKKEIFLDVSFYNDSKLGIGSSRDFELEKYNIEQFEIIVNTGQVLKNNTLSKLLRLYQRQFLPYYKWSYLIEKKTRFDENIFKIGENCYLDGYWQSHLYFIDIETTLKSQFTLKDNFSVIATNLLNKINSCQCSISIHVRRGDYLDKFGDKYTLLDTAYYKNAVSFIKEKQKEKKLNIFVFSQDIDWCKEHLCFDEETEFINNQNSFEDLLLMSYCDHNIIANSTFSWWAAWLNNDLDKIIVAPKQWYKNQESEFNNSIYPSTWTVL